MYSSTLNKTQFQLPPPSSTELKLQRTSNYNNRDSNRSTCFFGHVDAGKTTLMGCLLWHAGMIDNRSKEKHIREIETNNLHSGNTSNIMALAFRRVASHYYYHHNSSAIQHLLYHSHIFAESHHYTLFDTPGHRDFKYNFLRGLAQCDEVGCLVVSAAKGEFEAGMCDPTTTTTTTDTATTSSKNENECENESENKKESENKNETSSLDSPGQTREYSLLAFVHGIKSLLVVVNKMDSVDYDQERYLHIKQEVSQMLKHYGFHLDMVKFVPVSSSAAQNIIEPPNDSKFSSWWRGGGSNGNDVQSTTTTTTTTYCNDDINGLLRKNSSAAAASASSHATQQQTQEEEEDCQTLLEALESLRYITPSQKQAKESKELRILVRDVNKIGGIGTVCRGKIVQGVLKPGMGLCFAPSTLEAERKTKTLIAQSLTHGFQVKSIEMYHQQMSEAKPGDTVGFNIKGVGYRDIIRGSVCGLALSPKDRQVTTVSSFEAKLVLLPRSSKRGKPIKPGFQPTLAGHGTHCGCKIEYFSKLVKKDTNEVVESYPKEIDWSSKQLRHDCYLIARLKPLKEICVEPYREVPQLGRISLHDNGRTISIGVVTWCDYPATVRRWQRRRIVFAMKEFARGRLSKEAFDMYRVYALTVLFL